MAISAINSFAPMQLDLLGQVGQSGRASGVNGVASGGAAESNAGSSFADMVMRAMDRLNTVQNTADTYAAQAATGQLRSVEDYMAAATESQLMTQLTVAVRNKALEAYNEIIRMVV